MANQGHEDGAKDAEFSVGFLTALVRGELIRTEKVLKDAGWSPASTNPRLNEAGIKRWSKSIDGRRIPAYSMAIGKMGQTAAAIETFVFLTRCKPSLVFLTGIAGSLKKDEVRKKDVVVSLNTRYRTQNKVFGTGPADEYRPIDHPLRAVDADMSRKIQEFVGHQYPTGHDDWNVHTGELYTWDYVVDSARVVSRLNSSHPQALGVEMEGGGFLSSAERMEALWQRSLRAYVVKGISDYAEAKDSDDPTRSTAAANAAAVAVKLAEWMVSKKQMPKLP